jgi:uncharacterized membrane protein
MAFCPNCGAQAAGTFCPNCGTSLSGAAPGSGAQPQTPLAATSGMSENVAAALCYLFTFVTGIIFLVVAPYNQNKFIRFHAFQSIFFGVAWIALYVLVGFLTVVTHGIGILLYPLIGLAGFVLWLYMMFTAYNSKRVKLPVIGDLAEKQA